jgi:hypothetical protein
VNSGDGSAPDATETRYDTGRLGTVGIPIVMLWFVVFPVVWFWLVRGAGTAAYLVQGAITLAGWSVAAWAGVRVAVSADLSGDTLELAYVFRREQLRLRPTTALVVTRSQLATVRSPAGKRWVYMPTRRLRRGFMQFAEAVVSRSGGNTTLEVRSRR